MRSLSETGGEGFSPEEPESKKSRRNERMWKVRGSLDWDERRRRRRRDI